MNVKRLAKLKAEMTKALNNKNWDELHAISDKIKKAKEQQYKTLQKIARKEIRK